MYSLEVSLKTLKIPKLGPKTLGLLAEKNIERVIDLLFFLPNQYNFKKLLSMVSDLKDGQMSVMEGLVVSVERRSRTLAILLKDGKGQKVELVFFNVSMWHEQQLTIGKRLRIFGIAQRNRLNSFQFVHPDVQFLEWNEPFVPSIDPVYTKYEGLSIKAFKQALAFLLELDFEPAAYWPSLRRTLKILHAVELTSKEIDDYEILLEKAREHLAYLDGLNFFKQLHYRETWLALEAPKMHAGELVSTLFSRIPFQLTDGQIRVWGEIQEDLTAAKLMNRLIQGDVGSGKTILGFLAALAAVDAGYQAVMMAPTELLACQHYEELKELMGDLVPIGLLTGSLTPKQKKAQLQLIANGGVKIIIGTQALFQEGVEFLSLGLAVIDEQQRFGVAQRSKLLHKGLGPVHHLTLSATPIPRTLAMALFGQLQISVLKERPKGREPITTYTLSKAKIELALRSVKRCVEKGWQVYWVCPLIDQSEHIAAQAVVDSYEFLKEKLPSLRVGVMHGRLPMHERTQLIESFNNKTLDILASTLVIEVGIDNPNAALMVIESPERLGLAQLHQLRGRVGRGKAKSYCILVYGEDLTEQGIERLEALCQHDDGFALAEKDLEIRGPGEFLGAKQSGFNSLKFFDFKKHQNMIPIILQQLQSPDQISCELLQVLFGEIDKSLLES